MHESETSVFRSVCVGGGSFFSLDKVIYSGVPRIDAFLGLEALVKCVNLWHTSVCMKT